MGEIVKFSDAIEGGDNKESRNHDTLHGVIRFLFFPVLFAYMELMFHVLQFGEITGAIALPMILSAGIGFFFSFLTMLFPRKVNIVLSFIFLVITCIEFGLQFVYAHIFKTFISINSVIENAGDASEFWKETLHGILESLPALILLMVIPIVLLIVFTKTGLLPMERTGVWKIVSAFALSAAFLVGGAFALEPFGTAAGSAYDLFHNSFILDLGIEKLGVMTSTVFDAKIVISGSGDSEVSQYESIQALSELDGEEALTPSLTPTPTPSLAPSVTPTPTPTPIDTSPNVLDIDFEALAKEEKNSSIKSLHEYFAAAEPTKKNEYTGMFEGYNLIYMTCEGYSPWAVDEKLTPTLYKLTHSGFVFNNFYTPIWYTSTSDGEYVECTSLIPYSTNSFKRSKNNALPFCLGNIMSPLGYTTLAYHAHSATYYGRNETHPNMGYTFKAKRAGLDMTDQWPESDLEMMQLSIPEYINEEHFSVYYMTVSGHLEYNFSGNMMASKNKDLVADLPYSDAVKAYIACNIELDRALEYLISELEKAGIADKTLIAFGADHYPYGLTNEQISERAGHKIEENFELYKNNFVLWSASIEEPIVIDKYCSSLDMLPTVLNLLGIDYDSRLLMGSDILSDSPALVIFSNQSFITDYCMYNSKTGEVTNLTEVKLPKDYVKNVSNVVRNKFDVSKSILLNDYYRYLPKKE